MRDAYFFRLVRVTVPSIKIYLDFIDYRYCNSGKGDLYRRRFIDQKRPVCVKGSHESLVSIWVQICQQNALTVNPFSPQGKQYKFTSGSKSPLTHTCLVLNGCRIFRHKNLINENWKLCVPHREKYIQYNKLMLLLYIIIYNTLFQYFIRYFISVRYAFMVYSAREFFYFEYTAKI